MNKLVMVLFVLLLSGCAFLTPPSGTHYTVKYGEIEVEVDDYSDREGVFFEYEKDGTKVTLKKDTVDTATPAAAIAARSVENQSKVLSLLDKVIKE